MLELLFLRGLGLGVGVGLRLALGLGLGLGRFGVILGRIVDSVCFLFSDLEFMLEIIS